MTNFEKCQITLERYRYGYSRTVYYRTLEDLHDFLIDNNLEDGICNFWYFEFDEEIPIEINGYLYNPIPGNCEDIYELKKSLQVRIDWLENNSSRFAELDTVIPVCDLPNVKDPNQLKLFDI